MLHFPRLRTYWECFALSTCESIHPSLRHTYIRTYILEYYTYTSTTRIRVLERLYHDLVFNISVCLICMWMYSHNGFRVVFPSVCRSVGLSVYLSALGMILCACRYYSLNKSGMPLDGVIVADVDYSTVEVSKATSPYIVGFNFCY